MLSFLSISIFKRQLWRNCTESVYQLVGYYNVNNIKYYYTCTFDTYQFLQSIFSFRGFEISVRPCTSFIKLSFKFYFYSIINEIVFLPFLLSISFIYEYIHIYAQFNFVCLSFNLVILISLFISFSGILLNVIHFYIKVYVIWTKRQLSFERKRATA